MQIDIRLIIAAVVNRLDATLRLIDLKPAMPVVLPLTVNQPFVPTDVAGTSVGVTEVSTSVLP